MLFKSQIFTQVSGSVGGLTFARNRAGMYTRARTVPVDPQTAQQIAVRANMATLVVRWGTTLTDAQRAVWETYAANTPVLDKFGDSVNITGQQMFLRSNLSRLQSPLLVVDDGLLEIDLPLLQVALVNVRLQWSWWHEGSEPPLSRLLASVAAILRGHAALPKDSALSVSLLVTRSNGRLLDDFLGAAQVSKCAKDQPFPAFAVFFVTLFNVAIDGTLGLPVKGPGWNWTERGGRKAGGPQSSNGFGVCEVGGYASEHDLDILTLAVAECVEMFGDEDDDAVLVADDFFWESEVEVFDLLGITQGGEGSVCDIGFLVGSPHAHIFPPIIPAFGDRGTNRYSLGLDPRDNDRIGHFVACSLYQRYP